ncbi:MAG: alpha/beta fold hydrolase [Candidatus Vecturithrix sp.]|nr:alpha/beta fold hydrolase [Candidatus Vecturithrix sp.]
MEVFFLPFSGGTSYSYQKFKPLFPKTITMVAFELPGHGKRIREPLLTDIHAMVEDLYEQLRLKLFDDIQSRLHAPYAIYGHSLGALLAYLLTIRIVQEALPHPLHLFVSGHQGPTIPEKEKNLHLLPRQEFILRLQQYGGIPREVAEHQELMDLFAPMIQADFQAISDYHYTPAPKLDLPITALFGSEEEIARQDVSAWQEVTIQAIQVHEFPGKHFFIFEQTEVIVRLMTSAIFRNFT